jgi:inosose dehydratase
MPPLLAELGKLDRDTFTMIEQDRYPVEPHIPSPIGARTAGYYRGCGLGRAGRWPLQSKSPRSRQTKELT